MHVCILFLSLYHLNITGDIVFFLILFRKFLDNCESGVLALVLSLWFHLNIAGMALHQVHVAGTELVSLFLWKVLNDSQSCMLIFVKLSKARLILFQFCLALCLALYLRLNSLIYFIIN